MLKRTKTHLHKQVRPRLTLEEVRYLLHLIELQREGLRNYPDNFPHRSEAWNKLQEDVLWKERQVCKWLQQKFSKLNQNGKHAKPGVFGFMAQVRIPSVLKGLKALKEMAEAENLETEQEQPKEPEIDWNVWLRKPEGSNIER